jgi:hypothetical protein
MNSQPYIRLELIDAYFVNYVEMLDMNITTVED